MFKVRPWMILVSTTIPAFMAPFDGGVVNLALPAIGHSLAGKLSSLVWIPTSYFLAQAVLQSPTGRMGDVRGKKGVFSLGIVLFTVASLLASLSPNISFLIACRIIQGAGTASMSACSVAIVTDTFLEDRGRALGINTSAIYTGLTIGPIAGGFLVQDFGWRSIFYVNIPIGIISLLLVLLYVPPDTKMEVKKKFDVRGSLLLSAFLVALMLFFSQGEISLTQFEVLALALVSAASIAGFILVESKFTKDPIIDLKLFTQNRLFTAGNLTSIFNYTTNQGTVLIMSLYLQLVRGYSPISAALILFAQPLFQMVTSVISGILSDRVDARILSSVGIACRATGLFGLSLLTITSPSYAVWIPMAIVGFGHGMFSPPNTNSVMSSVSRDKRGIAAGVMGTIRTACNSTGIVVMSAIIAAVMPVGAFAAASGGAGSLTGSLGESFVAGAHYAFLFAGSFSAVGIITSFVRGKEDRSTEVLQDGEHPKQ